MLWSYPVSGKLDAKKAHDMSWAFFDGADEGDRTLVPSLGSSYSTTELHPHILSYYISLTVKSRFVKLWFQIL